MSLPSFTAVGFFKEILGDVLDDELVETAMARARINLTSNWPNDFPVVWDGVVERLDEPVQARIDSDTGELVDRNGDPLQLLAADVAISTNLQWRIEVVLPADPLSGLKDASLAPWWFNAGTNGTTVDVGAAVAIPGVKAIGTIRGPRGYPLDNVGYDDGTENVEFFVQGNLVGTVPLSVFLTAMSGGAPEDLDTLKKIADSLAEKQPLDSDLTAIAALTSAADKVPYYTGIGTADVADFTTVGRLVVGAANEAMVRAAIGAVSVDDLGQSASSLDFPLDGVTDCADAFDALVSDMGTIYMGGTFNVSRMVTVPAGTQVVGTGRTQTVIKAMAGFADAAVVSLGTDSGYAHGTRLQDVGVDANGVVGTCVIGPKIQEMSGLTRVLLLNYSEVGADFSGADAQNYTLEALELYPVTASAGVIGIKTGTARARSIRQVTVLGNNTAGLSAPTGSIGIQANGPVFVDGLHVESVVDGIVLTDSTSSIVSNVDGDAYVTNLVRILNTAMDNITLIALTPSGATNTLVDSLHGFTYPTYPLSFYTWGGGGVGSDTIITSAYGSNQRDQGSRQIVGALGVHGNTPAAQAAAITSPTSDTVGTKAAIDAIRTVLASVGFTA